MSALAESEAVDPFKEVLIIYNTRSGESGSFDSGLNSSEAGYLCFLFLIWLTSCDLGVVLGATKRALFSHVGFEDPDKRFEPEDKSGSEPK